MTLVSRAAPSWKAFWRGLLLSCALIFALLSGALTTGCLEVVEALGELADEDEGVEDKCDPAPPDCDRSRPTSAALNILVGGGALQEVKVYRGTAYEKGALVWSGSSGGSIRLPLGEYAATATYASGAKTIIAVDGDYLDYGETDTCDGSCYEELDGEVDLRLED